MEGKTVGLLDISKAKGDVFLDRVESVLRERYGVAEVHRFSKPTFTKPAPRDLRNEIATHILRLPLRFFGGRRMGELISNITNDTTVLSRGLTLACDHVVVDPPVGLLD